MLADLILEESLVRLLDPLGEVRKESEARYSGGELHDVLDLDVLTLDGGRRSSFDDRKHDLVELVGRHTSAATLVDLLNFLKYLEDTLLG